MSSRPAVRQLGRLSEIAQVAAKHGFGYLFERRGLRRSNGRLLEVDTAVEPGSSRGQRLRSMLDELGPTFVKFGQLLSTRPDVIPPDIVFELRGLQDQVTTFPYEDVERVVREELGLTIEQAFLEFDREPIAAASIGQVHRAILPNGDEVIVKVQRPDAPRQIEADLELMYQAARLGKIKSLSFVDSESLVDEFARSIRQELDYRAEARNAEQFHRNFAGNLRVRIPKVYWQYSRARVLTLEYLEGTQVKDVDLTTYTPDERRSLATTMAEAWMTMIFRHGFFHADPHPSNILVLEKPDTIGVLDFGMAGKLTDEDLSKATRLFIDVVNENIERAPARPRRARRAVRARRGRKSSWTSCATSSTATTARGSPRSTRSQVIREAFSLIFRMRLHLPTRFVLLDRAIATLGSVGLEVDPEFNVFEVAKPYARELVLERFTPRRVALRARQQGTDYARMLLELPYQVHDTLEQVRDGQVEVGFRHEGLEELFRRLDHIFNRLVIAVVVASGLLGSAILGIFVEDGPQLFGLHFLSVIGFVLSGRARNLARVGRHPLRAAVNAAHRRLASLGLRPRTKGRAMRAFTLDSFDEQPGLRDFRGDPAIGDGELLVRVRASSVNPVDNYIASGGLKGSAEHEFPVVVGRDFAGVVERVGSGVSRYEEGDEVFGFFRHANPTVHDGTWAELIAVPEDDSVAAMPRKLDFAQAGARPWPRSPRSPHSTPSRPPRARPCSSSALPAGWGASSSSSRPTRGRP